LAGKILKEFSEENPAAHDASTANLIARYKNIR
jgi:hypothetical protein